MPSEDDTLDFLTSICGASMRRIARGVAAVALTFGVLVILAGCADGSDDDETSGDPTATEPTVQATSPPVTATPDDAGYISSVLAKGNARIYYEDVGEGEAIITTHGVTENGGYWSETGVTARLAERYRVISMDMRAHGQTVVDGEPYGYDVETIADDIGDLADHLGLDRFHLLTHATGGMAGVRYAMTRSDRLISLMLTDTGSATLTSGPDTSPEESTQTLEAWAAGFEMSTVDQLLAGMRVSPGPFLFRMAQSPDSERMFEVWERIFRRGDPKTIADFLRSFYTDPDPHVEELRQITCPTLVLLGEYDIVFIEPSKLMAQEIPDVRHVIIEGVGHMTAIEHTERTISELLDFLDTVAATGRAMSSRGPTAR